MATTTLLRDVVLVGGPMTTLDDVTGHMVCRQTTIADEYCHDNPSLVFNSK